MLPPGQRWQSLSHRARVQHDPCAPQARSDLIDISGPAGEFLCLYCPRDAEITKHTSTSAVCMEETRDARRYCPAGTEKVFCNLFPPPGKMYEASQKGEGGF